ncbi:MAG: hypothetical protein PHR35_03805 [Kiritimatiellae bacterium]|nr:hypothetical protein [Kiritimatiellia bacterium]
MIQHAGEGSDDTPCFASAQPVWLSGRDREKNLFVGFRCVFARPSNGGLRLRIAASSLYRLFLNGAFVGHGPARGPHNFYRVDEYDLTSRSAPGINVMAVEVIGYNVPSYYVLNQPAFLLAEILDGRGAVLAATGASSAGFAAQVLPERVQRVQRYSCQRTFVECYQLAPDCDRWRSDSAVPFGGEPLAVLEPRAVLPRRVPFSEFRCCQPTRLVAEGRSRLISTNWRDPKLAMGGRKGDGFAESELACVLSHELAATVTDRLRELDVPWGRGNSFRLADRAFRVLDFGVERSGFLGMKVRCRNAARLYVTFDEIRVNGDVDWRRYAGCVNAISLSLQPGTYAFETLEPYALRYAKWMITEGDCEIEDAYVREYVSPDAERAHFDCSDPVLNRIYAAARETFRQNTVDIFMDCPGRERAGWLCDSFFTARVAADLCGNHLVERNFLENYVLPPSFANIPKGMVPDNYPADFPLGAYIPNWALWLVLQLEEYATRSGDSAMIERFRSRIEGVFEFFRPYLNTDGLLENLQSWVFIEWSKANEFTQDVNYPTNMLYAAALDAAGRLYGEPAWRRQAEAVREVVRRQSFDGKFFVDNAVRSDGRLAATHNRTEVCQYYAFFTDVATPETHPDLWQILLHRLGPGRAEGILPDIHAANALPGYFLRLEILSRYGQCRQILAELKKYFDGMACTTGTLWENNTPVASCNHGFASHVAHILFRDVLGVWEVDTVKRTLRLRFPDLDLGRCEGRIPTPDGFIRVGWCREGGELATEVQAPAGYRVY